MYRAANYGSVPSVVNLHLPEKKHRKKSNKYTRSSSVKHSVTLHVDAGSGRQRRASTILVPVPGDRDIFVAPVEDFVRVVKKECTIQLPLPSATTTTTPCTLLIIKEKTHFYALSPVCTYCGVQLVNGILACGQIRCPLHGTAFDVKTGKLEEPPGFDSLASFGVKIVQNALYVSSSPEKLKATRVIMSLPKQLIPSPDHGTVVIIGAGPAGLSCAETLRHEEYLGRIILVSRESSLPYDRSQLSKCLQFDEEKARFRPKEFYESCGIELMLNAQVENINFENKKITLTNAESLTYSDLVLAMGSINRQSTVKGSELEGVLQLRDITDLNTIFEETERKHVIVIGAGFIALDIASAIGRHARSVSIFGKSETPLRSFGIPFGRDLRSFIYDHAHAQIRQGTHVRSIDGFDRVTHMVLKDGLCAVANTVIVANGVLPNTSFLTDSSIALTPKGHVIVDDAMRTNQSNVYAVGDVTEFPSFLLGPESRTVLPHLGSAFYQGKVAAMTIVGKAMVNDYVPFLWLDAFHRHFTFCGDNVTPPTDTIIRGSIVNRDYRCYYLEKENVIAVVDCSSVVITVQFLPIFKKKIKITKKDVENNPNDDWSQYLS